MSVVNVKRRSNSWVREAEHIILRAVSLVFSMASAYAIRLFFAPLDAADPGERVITWGIAVGFGILGYVVSRGLVHRMMNRESIWGYAPICVIVEVVDIACNYVLAASVVHQAWWLGLVPVGQRGILTFLTYLVLSVIPLVSLFLSVADMDLERAKSRTTTVAVQGQNVGRGQIQAGRPGGQVTPRLNPGAGNNGTQANGPQTASRGPAGVADKDKQRAQRANLFGGPRQQGPAAQPAQVAAGRGAGNNGGNGAGSVGTLLHDPEKWVPVE